MATGRSSVPTRNRWPGIGRCGRHRGALGNFRRRRHDGQGSQAARHRARGRGRRQRRSGCGHQARHRGDEHARRQCSSGRRAYLRLYAVHGALHRARPHHHAAGKWEKKSLQGTELRGKTLGIVGLGRVGVEVSRRALAFGMKVVAHDPYVAPSLAQQLNVSMVPLDELYAQSDYITLHVGLTPQTQGMINADSIAQDEERRAAGELRSRRAAERCRRGRSVAIGPAGRRGPRCLHATSR